MMYADVIVPLAVARTYTYQVPEWMVSDISVGARVYVELGRRCYCGIVSAVDVGHDPSINYKPVMKLLDKVPMVPSYQIELWSFIASYYCCSIGDVLKMALPVSWAKDDYVTKTETYVAKTSDTIPDGMKLTSKQRALYDAVSDEMPRRQAVSLGSDAVLRKLIEKGLLVEEKHTISRIHRGSVSQDAYTLSDAQQKAYDSIKHGFASHKPVLLHGVTSSGKTQIYMQLIREVIESGGQVLYLVPEITLTEHLAHRLQRQFGDRMLVYHSKVGDDERAEMYRDINCDESLSLVVGVRSAIFLPYRNLRLIIVDEEHDASYKQWEPAPRYNARNVALYLARLVGADILLGSATPSLEVYHKALSQRYQMVELTERYDGALMPQIRIIDRRSEMRKGRMTGIFSWYLIDAIRDRLARGEQVILFQNRRGYNTFTKCQRCGWTPKCPKCDVGLTYHQSFRRLSCHYCSHTQEMPAACPQCGDVIDSSGIGTERVEDELRALFPDVVVSRLDVDTAHTRNAYLKILDDFSSGRSQVLIGTQMVVKGLDFGNVTLVGIINGDNMLDYPEFRATERSFQMFVQVAGRAGRRLTQGEVVLQTSQPDHPIMEAVRCSDYRMFYDMQIGEREMFRYPPFYRVIQISVKHNDARQVDSIAQELSVMLQRNFGAQRVMGPFVPPLSRQRLMYIRQITIKVEAGAPYKEVNNRITTPIADIRSRYSSARIVIDVDPA